MRYPCPGAPDGRHVAIGEEHRMGQHGLAADEAEAGERRGVGFAVTLQSIAMGPVAFRTMGLDVAIALRRQGAEAGLNQQVGGRLRDFCQEVGSVGAADECARHPAGAQAFLLTLVVPAAASHQPMEVVEGGPIAPRGDQYVVAAEAANGVRFAENW